MTAPGLRIRLCRDDDEVDVVALWRDCGLVVPHNDPFADFRRKRDVQPDLFLVAEQEGEIVGVVMAGYEGRRGWINYLGVSPAHERRGVGRSLMERAEEELRKRGCPKINLQVRTGNTEIIAFYKRLGYDMDEVVSMGKRLEP